MKRLGKFGIIFCTILLCACVFPLCLVRKNANVDPYLEGEFGVTAAGQNLTQTFIAQTQYLSELVIDIGFPNGKPSEGSLLVCLKEESGKQRVLAEKVIELKDVPDGALAYVTMDKWLKKGELYSYTIIPTEGTQVEFQAFYTVDAGHTPGNQEMYFDGEYVYGQAVTRYVYSYPLNYKNIICLWALICMVGLTIYEMLEGKSVLAECRLMQKLEALLVRWQIPVLILEFLVIMLMVIRICDSGAVHWDEAYTWQMVTKNTLPEMLKATAADVHPPLYYMLVMAAMKIFGQKLFVAKMVSVAGAVATSILGITLVRKNWGVKAAIPFLLVTGLAPVFIYYNVDVRMYSWLCFFVMAAGLFAYEIMKSGKLGWWAAFTLVSLGGVYTQYFAVVPLAFIYLFLLVWIILRDRRQIKKWIGCSIATVLGYLPWLPAVVNTLKVDAESGKGEPTSEGIMGFLTWAFQSNIKFSEFIPVILFITAIVCFIAERRNYTNKEKAFLVLSGGILCFTYGVCMLLAGTMNHFWDNRYLFGALLFFWLFLIIILARKNLVTWGLSMICMGVLVLSSYTVMKSSEMEADVWIQHANQLFDYVQEEEVIIYTFPTFDVLYGYYVPNAEFVWYEDVDFTKWQGEYYVLSWGNDFPYELYASGMIRKEIIGSMRLEEGITTDLWKIVIRQ